ncbi:hypothetical protein D3C81_1575600 [compost metagenome]
MLQRLTNLLKEQLDQLLGFTLVQAQLLMEAFGDLGFRQGLHTLTSLTWLGTFLPGKQ